MPRAVWGADEAENNDLRSFKISKGVFMVKYICRKIAAPFPAP